MKFLLVLLLVLDHKEFVELLTVETTSGLLNGVELKTLKGKIYHAFLGVPYAAPPLGGNRFKKPQPIEYWNEVRSAHNYGSRCIQFVNAEQNQIEGDEDCLYLNIFTPNVPNPTERWHTSEFEDPYEHLFIELDTLFYIHGGAFKHGSGDEVSPEYILEHYNIIFVTFNYRLGPFGFFSTEDKSVPGNAGLKDQVLALKWVRNNIEVFGGDKYKITIAGWSAGGASVHLHYFSSWSKGLFRQGISFSGSAFCPWVMTEDARSKALVLGESFSCPTSNTKNLVTCLQKIPAKDILLRVESLFSLKHYQGFSPFSPVVEKTRRGFLTRKPYDILMDGDITDAPWLTGVTDMEGLHPGATFVNDEKVLKELDKNWNQIAPQLLYYHNSVLPESLDQVSQSIRHFYLGNKNISKENKRELIKLIGDRIFVLGVEQAALMQAAVVSSSVYFYKFAYRGMHSLSESFFESFERIGASHGDDLIYWLKLKDGKYPLTSIKDRHVMNITIYMLHNFLWQGMPKLTPQSEWQRLLPGSEKQTTNLTFMLISSAKDFKIISREDLSNRYFWENLPIKEFWNSNHDFSNQYMFNGYDEL